MRAMKHIILALCVICTCAVAGFAQTTTGSDSFSTTEFRELATRAEGVVDRNQASTSALEILRADLFRYRRLALAEQEAHARRVTTIQQQIAALGAAPEEGQTESLEVAALRVELQGQLAEARAPLIVAQEAYRRADGLVGEIDTIVRARQTSKLLELNETPLNPVLWWPAAEALSQHVVAIAGEVKAQWETPAWLTLLKNRAPLIFVLVGMGMFLIGPFTRWTLRRLEGAGDTTLRTLGNIPRLLVSLASFLVPMAGLSLILFALILADIVALRGEYVLRALPAVGLSIFGGNWLAANLPQGKIYSGDVDNKAMGLVLGGQRTIRVMGWVLALFFILEALNQGAQWPSSIYVVLTFPIIFLLGYGLFRLGRKLAKYAASVDRDTEVRSINERTLGLCVWVLYLTGVGGPILAALGYLNAALQLVFSATLSFALASALFFVYVLLVRFVSKNITDEDTPQGLASVPNEGRSGLYRVALGFALICLSLPVFALIWGARQADISSLWFTLKEGVPLGETRVSITDFLVFILIFFIGYTVTRLIQSILRSSVLQNTRIEAGAQNAIVTGFGYVGIFLSALVAIMSTGLDLSSLAIVAGALSVGIGFGLQAIVSNFVSGIILLIERPIKIGDWVEVGAFSGVIRKISVRSTMIETFDRATVIVPNADLITGAVTNWTHGDVRGRVKVPIGVAYGTDPKQVEQILLEIAHEHPQALKLPKPWVLFSGFGDSSMNFELRAIVRDVNSVLGIRSDMNYEIVSRFEKAGIEIPFVQREITIKHAQDLIPAKKAPAKRKAARKPKA